jgi:hypothetical protein
VQTLHQDGDYIALGDCSDDSAHRVLLPFPRRHPEMGPKLVIQFA